MQTIPAKDNFGFIEKALRLNGVPSIQFFSASHVLRGSLLKKENVLLIVTNGIFNIRLGKMRYTVRPGNMAFLAKDTSAEYAAAFDKPEDGRIEYLVITLPCDIVKEFVKIAALPVFTCVDRNPVKVNTIDVGLKKYLDCLQVYMGETQEIADSLVKIKLLELLFYMSRYYIQMLILALDIKENYRPGVTNAVEENMLNSLSLSQLAVLSGRSLSSFRRDFLATYKMPPSQYIRQKKLEKAKELLQSTTLSITDICYTIGFENIAHFSRLFKSRFRHSPSAFRQGNYAA